MRPTAAKVTQVTGSEWLSIAMKDGQDRGAGQILNGSVGQAATGRIFWTNLQPGIDCRVCSLLVLQSCGLELVALVPFDTLGGAGRFPSQSESEARHG
jgi:hypothetical protein